MPPILITEHYLDAASAAVGLEIPAELKPGVQRYLQLAAGMAERVLDFPLALHDEAGHVFLPVEPAGADDIREAGR